METVDTSKLPSDGFTAGDANELLGWDISYREAARRLSALGYTPRRTRGTTPGLSRVLWFRSELPSPTCTCRCHTGTCGENAMVLAERTLRLIEKLRPLGPDMVAAIEAIVDRAGVDFAREALQLTDDEVPF